MRKRIRLYLLQPQLRDDIRNRASESRAAHKFLITAKLTSLGQFMNRAIRYSLSAYGSRARQLVARLMR